MIFYNSQKPGFLVSHDTVTTEQNKIETNKRKKQISAHLETFASEHTKVRIQRKIMSTFFESEPQKVFSFLR